MDGKEGISLGITGGELVLYIVGGLVAIGIWITKKVATRIEINYDKRAAKEEESRKELWIEVNNLRERMAKIEGKQGGD